MQTDIILKVITMKTISDLIREKNISALFRLKGMSRDDAVKFIEENPEDVHDLLIFVSESIVGRVIRAIKGE